MTRDPLERIRPDGIIVTGVARSKVPVLFEDCLADVTDRVMAVTDSDSSLYLYGSVATGQATIPTSDVDLLVIADDPPTAVLATEATALSSKYSEVAREIAIVSYRRMVLDEDSPDGHAMRCFVRHYCVHLAGENIADILPDAQASARLAWTFNHDVGKRVDRLRESVLDAQGSESISQACNAVARDLLLASTSVASILGETWTTDRATAAQIIATHCSEWATSMETLVGWLSLPTHDKTVVLAMLNDYGTWLVNTMESHRPPDVVNNH